MSKPANTSNKSVFKITIDAPIDKVWAELTRTDVQLPFFFNARLDTPELAVGSPIRMRSGKQGQYTGVVGDVLEFEPPHRYSHTFKFTNLDDPPCKVTYLLKDLDGKTEFTLINEDVPAGTKTEKYMEQGGEFITTALKALVEGGGLPLKIKMILLMIKLTAWMTPKESHSENWPFDRRL